MTNPGGRGGPGRLIDAARWSLAGLAAAFRHEAAFRQEVACAVLLVPLGLWLGDGGAAKAMLVASVLLVLVVELLNSAIEAAVDRISPETHELSGRAKDFGSAAVMVALIACGAVWVLVLAL